MRHHAMMTLRVLSSLRSLNRRLWLPLRSAFTFADVFSLLLSTLKRKEIREVTGWQDSLLGGGVFPAKWWQDFYQVYGQSRDSLKVTNGHFPTLRVTVIWPDFSNLFND